MLALPAVEAPVEVLLGVLFEGPGAALPPFAAGGFLVPPCGGAGAGLLLCAAAGFGLRVDGWVETWLCEGMPPVDVGTGFIGTGFIGAGWQLAEDLPAPWSRPARSLWHQATPRMAGSLFPALAPARVQATIAAVRTMTLN